MYSEGLPGQHGTTSPVNRESKLAALLNVALQQSSNSGQRNNMGGTGGDMLGRQSPRADKKRRGSQGSIPVQNHQESIPTAAQAAHADQEPQPTTLALQQQLQAAHDKVLHLQQQLEARDITIRQMTATMFQRVIQGAKVYLGIAGHGQQIEASDGVWPQQFPPLGSLSPAEQQAAKQIMEPLRQAEVARIRQQLSRLQGMETAALPAAPSAAPAPAGFSSQAPAQAPAHSGSSSGSPHAADAAAAAQAMQDAVAAAVAASQAATSSADAVTQHQEHSALQADAAFTAQQIPASQLAPWMAHTTQTQPDMQAAWGNTAWMGQAAAAAAGAMLGLQSGSAGNLAAAGQQQWGMAAQGAGAGGESFSLRSPQHVGVYRSRRSEQGWRAQFSFANKVGAFCWVARLA